MTRRRTSLAGVSLLFAAALAVAGCASASASGASTGDITVAGTTRVDLVTVSAPAPSTAGIDVTVGIAKLQTPVLIAARRKAASASAASRAARPAGILTSVTVRPGDTVKKGQVLARLDDRMLRVAVDDAEAASRKAVATADTMKANASTLRDQRSTVLDARSLLLQQQTLLSTQSGKVASQIDQIKTKIGQLTAALEGLRAARATLAGQLAAAERAASSPTPPPGIQKVIGGLKAALGKVDAKIGQLEGALAGLNAALPQLEAVSAKMAQGATQMVTAKATIATALSKMADGIDQLEQASSTMKIAAKAQSAGVDLARFALDQATMRAPVDGTIVSALPAGQLAMVGAPVVVIRPRTAVLVDAYLSPDQVSRVKAGDKADVTLDSLPKPLPGRVKTIWPSVEFPPNNYPTPIVHLAYAVRVTVEVPDQRLPLGVPADVVIHPSR